MAQITPAVGGGMVVKVNGNVVKAGTFRRERAAGELPIPTSGMSANSISFFRARGLRKIHEGGGDESEDITVHEVPLAAAESWLGRMQKKGRLIDPKIFVGLYFLNQRSQ